MKKILQESQTFLYANSQKMFCSVLITSLISLDMIIDYFIFLREEYTYALSQ